MILRKIFKQSISWKQKIRRLLLWMSRKNGADKSWKKRHALVFKKHPEYRRKLSKSVEQHHRELWSSFRIKRNIPIDSLKICAAISGVENPEIIPEEIFQADIEPSLNHYSDAHYLANKSFYSRWLPNTGFPACKLHVVDGEFFDGEFQQFTNEELIDYLEALSYPVIAKPSLGTYSAIGVKRIDSRGQLKEYLSANPNVVVQDIAEQDSELAQFHPKSLNTVRVYLYRSGNDNRVHILNRALRTGNGQIVDNVGAGGLVTLIRERGQLNGYALDRYGKTYEKHPITGIPFKGEIPDIQKLDKLAKKVARQLFLLRLVGLDLYYDKNREWRMLEINTKGHSIRFSQYAGHPFFGKFTEEVIEYCKENHWALTV